MTEKKITQCSAAILAGGKNTRYGGFHKAFLRIDNELIIQHHLSFLKIIFEDVMIIANDIDIFSQFQVPVFEDIFKNRGPLAGIHSALQNTDKEAVIIFGCDMPNIQYGLIKDLYNGWLNSEKDYCVPKIDSHVEPLFALYSKKALPQINDWLINKKENAVYRFLEIQDVHYLEKKINKSVFLNINSPEDIAKLRNY